MKIFAGGVAVGAQGARPYMAEAAAGTGSGASAQQAGVLAGGVDGTGRCDQKSWNASNCQLVWPFRSTRHAVAI